MPTFGNTLFSELNGPKELVDQAAASEEAGVDRGDPGVVLRRDGDVVNFDAAVSTVRDEDLAEVAGIGSNPDAHVEAIMAFVDAGYDEVCVVQVGDDKDGSSACGPTSGATARQGRRLTGRPCGTRRASLHGGCRHGRIGPTRTWLSW